MKNFLAIFKAENILKSVKNIFSRFPVSAILSIFCTIIFILIENHSILNYFTNNTDIFIRIGFATIITFFLSVSVYIFSESKNFSKIKSHILQFFVICYGIIFLYFFSPNIENIDNIVFFIINLIGIISFLFFAPYTKKICCKKYDENPKNQENFYSYFTNILSIFLGAFLVGLVVFSLVSIGIFTINSLFDFHISSSSYIHTWFISAFFIAPFYALNSIPEKETFEKGKFNENNFGLFLMKYIFIPAIFMYFIILYAYSIKVLINFNSWPKGEVSWLVIGFSVLGYFIYLLSYMYEEKIMMVKRFRKYFPIIVFPQIFMLFYAIFLRIKQYNLTMNRYFVVILGFFLLFITIYFIFSKRKYLGMILASIFSFSIIFSVLPWSVYKLPETIQTNILKEKMSEIGMISEDGKIIPVKDYDNENTEKNKKIREIKNKIDYICNYHNCAKLSEYLTNKEGKIEKQNYNSSFNYITNWQYKNLIYNYLKIDTNYYYDYDDYENSRIYFNKINTESIDIKGYDFFSEINSWDYKENYTSFDLEKKKIYIYEKNKKIGEINIENIFNDIEEKGNFNENENLIYEIEDNYFKIKIIITNYHFSTINGKINLSKDYYNNLNGYILYLKK